MINKNNAVVIVEDDDLIPPTPSPAGQHNFINCRGQGSASSTNIQQLPSSSDVSQADGSNDISTVSVSLCKTTGIATKSHDVNGNKVLLQDLQDKRTINKFHDHLSPANSEQTPNKKDVVKTNRIKSTCNLGATSNNKESDLIASSCNSVETPSTLTTSRKKYKLSRKPKLPKFVSSPLKKHDICGSVTKSAHNTKQWFQEEAEQPNQKESTTVIAPSKCVVLRSRIKRPATKGSSPLQKRLQTDLPLSVKVLCMLPCMLAQFKYPTLYFCIKVN